MAVHTPTKSRLERVIDQIHLNIVAQTGDAGRAKPPYYKYGPAHWDEFGASPCVRYLCVGQRVAANERGPAASRPITGLDDLEPLIPVFCNVRVKIWGIDENAAFNEEGNWFRGAASAKIDYHGIAELSGSTYGLNPVWGTQTTVMPKQIAKASTIGTAIEFTFQPFYYEYAQPRLTDALITSIILTGSIISGSIPTNDSVFVNADDTSVLGDSLLGDLELADTSVVPVDEPPDDFRAITFTSSSLV